MKPMLACKVEEKDLDKLHYPLYASIKKDGIRCLVKCDRAMSRSLKDIPNVYIRETLLAEFKKLDINDAVLDGELIIGKTFAETSSGVMSKEGTPDFKYVVFDIFGIGLKDGDKNPYFHRNFVIASISSKVITHHIQYTVNNPQEVLDLEKKALEDGEEGLILRGIYSPYKFGRSTLKEGYLIKFKRFEDGEAEIIAFEEKMHNNNEATVDNLGHTKRSQVKEGLEGANTLGAIKVRDVVTGIEFSIGSGFNDLQRQAIWDNQEPTLGKIVKYSHFANSGVKDKPRFPTFKGFRSKDDM